MPHKAVPSGDRHQNEIIEPVSENKTDALTKPMQSVNEDSDEPVTEVLQPVTSSEADTVDAEETPEEFSEKEELLQNDSGENTECDDSSEKPSEAEENSEANPAQTSAEISEKEAVGETISSEPPEPNIKSPPAFTKILHQAACRSGGANDGSIEITMEEMQLLLADPEFWEYEAKFAEMVQKNLNRADDSSE